MLDIYEDYGILVSQIDELTKKKDEMRDQILKELVDKKIDKPLETTLGNFSVVYSKVYEYPEEIKAMDSVVKELSDKLKAKKKLSEDVREAVLIETKPSLRFNKTKL